jgi:hypothetical protein
MHRTIAGRGIPDTGGHVVVLRARRCHHLDARTDAISIALRPFQRNIQPVPGVLRMVHPNLRILAQRRFHHIHSAVAVEVCKGAAAVPRWR